MIKKILSGLLLCIVLTSSSLAYAAAGETGTVDSDAAEQTEKDVIYTVQSSSGDYETEDTAGQDIEADSDSESPAASPDFYVNNDEIPPEEVLFEDQDPQIAAEPDIVSVESQNAATGEFTVRIYYDSNAAFSDIYVPVWSMADKSDIVWYKAYKDGYAWFIKGSLAGHKYHLGNYYVDAYVKTSDGMSYIGSDTMQWTLGCSDLEADAINSQSQAVLSIYDVQPAGVVRQVGFAVWSQENGQDDINWYFTDAGADGIFTKTRDLSAHRGTGKYNVHCYANTYDGSMVFLNSAVFELKNASAQNIEVSEVEPSTGKFTVSVAGLTTPSGLNYLSVPVWCAEDQSDLVWYQAEKQGNEYIAECFLKNHKYHTGRYKIDIYVRNRKNQMEYIGGKGIDINAGYSDFIIRDKNGDEKQFDIRLSGLTTFGAPVSVYYAVWSAAGGQDDIRWYQAGLDNSDYVYTVNTADHRSGGLYNVHCYMRQSDGRMEFVCSDTFTVSSAASGKLTFKANNSTGNLTLTLSNIKSTYGVKTVEAEIWCREDKSDLVRYTLAKSGKNYKTTQNISGHGYHTGRYHANVYLTDENDIINDAGSAAVNMEMYGGVLSADQTDSDLVYPLTLSEFKFCGSEKSVSFAVWSEEGGQDDLVWYNASLTNGAYTADVMLQNHMTAGRYFVDAYVRLKDNSMKYAAGITFQVQRLPNEKAEIINFDREKGTFDVRAVVLKKQSSYDKVMIPTWSKSDQSNIRWYEAERQDDGSYLIHVDIKNHGFAFGTFYSDVYVRQKDGSMIWCAGTNVLMEAVNYVISNPISNSAMQITVYGASAFGEEANEVFFPTWSTQDGQDDIVWYRGTKNSDGGFCATIVRGEHAVDGEYMTHIYVESDSGRELVTYLRYNLSAPVTYDSYASSVMRNIIFAVETGGQVYGNARYDDFTQAYKNTANETAITIGAGAWFANEAKRLLNLIRTEDPNTFAALDTAGIANDLDTQNWQYYGTDGKGNVTITKDSAKAKCIQRIISSSAGVAIQNRLVEEQMAKYISEAENLGVYDLKARMFCANIRHLGGYSSMKRTINNCITDGRALTMENLWQSMLVHDSQSASATQVGSPLFHSRHIKVMQWLNKYIG